jgi:hypothetical protein
MEEDDSEDGIIEDSNNESGNSGASIGVDIETVAPTQQIPVGQAREMIRQQRALEVSRARVAELTDLLTETTNGASEQLGLSHGFFSFWF